MNRCIIFYILYIIRRLNTFKSTNVTKIDIGFFIAYQKQIAISYKLNNRGNKSILV